MYDAVEAAVAKQLIDELCAPDIALDQPVCGILQERRYVDALSRRVVEIVEVVEIVKAVPSS